MSGHNKWSKIHRQKSVADSKRGALFTKLGNVISMAAKQGGGDVTMNFKLQIAIDQAKGVNMPKDNIERAIKRGTGELAGGTIEEVVYEGFGPDGVAFIIECLTDNRNRTAAEIKRIFTKAGGNLGGPNSVAWMFEQKGVVVVNQLDESLELGLIDAGAGDIKKNGEAVIYCPIAEIKKIKDFLEDQDVKIQSAEIQYIAKKEVVINKQTEQKIEKMVAELDDNEDVNNFYTNAKAE